MLKATCIRVQNFRNLDDSGWVPVERGSPLLWDEMSPEKLR